MAWQGTWIFKARGLVLGDLKGLMGNAKVVRYLAKSYPEILSEFQKIVESRSLDDTSQTEL